MICQSLSGSRLLLTSFARTDSFRTETTCSTGIFIKFLKESSKILSNSWSLILCYRLEDLKAQFLIYFLKSFLGCGSDVFIFVAKTVHQTLGVVSDIRFRYSVFIDYNEMKNFESAFFSSFKIWAQVGKNMFSTNIFSDSSQGSDNFISILLIFIRESLDQSQNECLQVRFYLFIGKRDEDEPGKMNKNFD